MRHDHRHLSLGMLLKEKQAFVSVSVAAKCWLAEETQRALSS